MGTKKQFIALILLTTFTSLKFSSIYSFEYEVGGNNIGWSVPPSNDSTIYNEWAAQNRFMVGDTIRFKYRKDSVMVVSEEDYKKCNSSHPTFFSNTGNTVYELDNGEAFFFISGAYGHCEKGQRMIIKVVSVEDESSKKSSPSCAVAAPCIVLILHIVLSFVVVA